MSLLETEGLTKHFGGVTAVQDVDLSVPEGEITSLIGPNGAGKTTLFNMLTGSLEPSSGEVRFQGEEITGLPPEEIAREGVARSFQITNVFEGVSVLENVRVAVQARHRGGWNFYQDADNKQEYIDEAMEILSTVGLAEQRDQQASALSHGAKRSLEIGITLATGPDLLLLDEPAAGMSQVEIEELLDLVDDLAREYTIMLVEHNMDIVMNISDTVTVLHNGAIISTGPPETVRADESVQEAYLGGGA
ncbi:ABC transporter ATP-binding protein [Salinirussus salinus]|jgi:branched-chain amino acid transport system ATP-binding protein|uniref:ABC transporter ATP-binding protein n=1 Tax=Salinirussus salinus TaxID=1198300 RepID=UPI001358F8B3|nr:ABC transporter ATP-binding protein [Salinirussus salinus]